MFHRITGLYPRADVLETIAPSPISSERKPAVLGTSGYLHIQCATAHRVHIVTSSGT